MVVIAIGGAVGGVLSIGFGRSHRGESQMPQGWNNDRDLEIESTNGAAVHVLRK
jgi:hypothetical protein